jgi:hypothetical protein
VSENARPRLVVPVLLVAGLATLAFFGARALSDEPRAAPAPPPGPTAPDGKPAVVPVASLSEAGRLPALRRAPRRRSTASTSGGEATAQQQSQPQPQQPSTTPPQSTPQPQPQPQRPSAPSGDPGSGPVDPNPSE